MNKGELCEFKINIEETPKKYINYLILGLVHSGYNIWFDFDRHHICFEGWGDEIIVNKKGD